MTHGFIELSIPVQSTNGRDDVLLGPLHFKALNGITYRVPADSTTDGMSTPKVLHALPGFEPNGKHWFSAVLHDAAYRRTLECFKWTNYQNAKLSRRQADDLFAEALETQEVPGWRIAVIYRMLRWFGAKNFKRHG